MLGGKENFKVEKKNIYSLLSSLPHLTLLC